MQRCENRVQPWQRLGAFIKLLAGIVAVLSVYAMISILILLLTSDLKCIIFISMERPRFTLTLKFFDILVLRFSVKMFFSYVRSW